MAMQTSCPHCGTEFRVDEELVQALDARVRCGMCHWVFNARDRLLADPATTVAPGSAQQDLESTPSLLVESRRPRFEFDRVGDSQVEDSRVKVEDSPTVETDVAATQDAARTSPEFDDEPEIVAPPQAQRDIFEDTEDYWDAPNEDPGDDSDAFELLRMSKPVQRSGSGWWLVGSLLLLTMVIGQWVYANRVSIIATAQIRPLLVQACGYLDCVLDPLRDVTQIEILRRSVYSHPNIDKALIISLAMVNNANYAQQFPVLAIRMADVRGKFVAQRNFQPERYLDAPSASGLMAPGAPITVTLEIHDPGNDALTFELDFL